MPGPPTMIPFRNGTRILSVFVALALVSGCGEQADSTTPTSQAAEPTSTTTTPPSATTTTPIAGAQGAIDWFIAVLNGEELTETGYEERFADSFRQQVPFAEGFQPVLDQLRPGGPFTVTERSGEGSQGEAIIEAADGTEVRVIAELDGDGRFTTLLIQPTEAPTLDDPPESIVEATERLAELGDVRMLAAEVIDGRCVPVEQVSASEPAPLGSVAKLYVLAALGEAVSAGSIAWDDEVEIREELKSVPTGVLQDRPAGETVTVREMAELMISISDNTATDHLIDLLGREAVEAVMAEYGHSDPSLNTPFLSTRELTALKVGPASGLYLQWLEGDETTRRGILEQISDITPADLPVAEMTEPVEPDTIEWFASPQDLCALAVGLTELSEREPEIGEILGVNPGVPTDDADRVWFKGGSEPGLLAAWWVTEKEGRRFVTAGSVVDRETAFDTDEAVLLFAAARDLLDP